MISTRPIVAPAPVYRSSHASSSAIQRPSVEQTVPVKIQVKQDKGKLTELWGSPPVIIVRDANAQLTRGDLLGEVHCF